MIGFLRKWTEHRRELRRRWQEGAKRLAAADPVNAHYEAQRRAARSRAQRNVAESWHWAKVARIEPRAEMDFVVVKAIADQEAAGRN